jgi:DNA repair exonuclease SbcCD ATPase subunit
MQQIIKRLELIKTSITLGDEEIIILQRMKLLQMELDPAACDILDAIERREYASVVSAIDRYISQFSELVPWLDGELQGLRLELKTLEVEVATLSDEKNELQFQLDKFQQQYHTRLGALLRDILELRKRIESSALRKKQRDYEVQAAAYRELKKQLDDLKQQRDELEEKQASCDEFSDEYDQIVEELQALNELIRKQEEALNAQRQRTKTTKESLDDSPEQRSFHQAQQDFEAFEETHQAIINEDRQALSDEEEQTLKAAYRRAARLCHPDLVSDELKDQAHRIMQALNLAKDKGDLAAVEEILYKLQNGLGFEVASNTITDKNVLRAKIAELRRRIDDLHAELAEMQQSTAVQVASVPADWDEYLNEKEAQLQSEHRRLSQMLAEVDPDAVNEMVESTHGTSPGDGDDFWRRAF